MKKIKNDKVIQKVCEEGEGWSWHDKKFVRDAGKTIDIDDFTLQYLRNELAELEAETDTLLEMKGE